MEQITLNAGAVRVTDPCYEPDVWCAATIHDILPGKWNCEVEESSGVICSLTIRHEDYPYLQPRENIGFAAVDSGQCGFFDPDYFGQNQPDNDYDNPQSWYRRVCELTLNHPSWGTIEGKGVVSSSGYGDGSYDIFACRNDSGHIVGLQLWFM